MTRSPRSAVTTSSPERTSASPSSRKNISAELRCRWGRTPSAPSPRVTRTVGSAPPDALLSASSLTPTGAPPMTSASASRTMTVSSNSGTNKDMTFPRLPWWAFSDADADWDADAGSDADADSDGEEECAADEHDDGRGEVDSVGDG